MSLKGVRASKEQPAIYVQTPFDGGGSEAAMGHAALNFRGDVCSDAWSGTTL